MSAKPLELAALVGARICHDLSSPLGAISNGVELLGMTGGAAGPELSLVAESAEGAVARLRFLRLAFGSGSGDEMIGAEAMAALVSAGMTSARLAISWEVDGPVRRDRARLAALLLLCVEVALPAGGRIRVSGDMSLLAEAPRIAADGALWDMLNSGAQPVVTPSTVQFALAALAAREAGRPIRAQLQATRIEIAF